MFQSTRPRGARRGFRIGNHRRDQVSIHAPARGATQSRSRISSLLTGFNPRARAGRDCFCMSDRNLAFSFNPRARAGRDLRSDGGYGNRSQVSIHAPARGATLMAVASVDPRDQFQSTRPRGARPLEGAHERPCEIVSIHAPARGATVTGQGYEHTSVVSIHAPARGATSIAGTMTLPWMRFNPRARAGRDPADCPAFLRGTGFNPRARAGRD